MPLRETAYGGECPLRVFKIAAGGEVILLTH